MQTITTTQNLMQVLNQINYCCISNDTGDACYLITKFEQSFPDESSIHIITYGINQHQEVDLEPLAKILSDYLPWEIREAFLKEEHLYLINGIDSLEIHFNDSTITCIHHCTGQY